MPKKKKRAKKVRAKKAGGIFTKLKAKISMHTHALPTCGGGTEDPECAGKKKRLSCNQVTIAGKSVAVCTHLR